MTNITEAISLGEIFVLIVGSRDSYSRSLESPRLLPEEIFERLVKRLTAF